MLNEWKLCCKNWDLIKLTGDYLVNIKFITFTYSRYLHIVQSD